VLIACFVTTSTFLCFWDLQIWDEPCVPLINSAQHSIFCDNHLKVWKSSALKLTYLRKSTTLLSGKKWTPVLGSSAPYLFLSSRPVSSNSPVSPLFSPSMSFWPTTSLFSSYFIITKNSANESFSWLGLKSFSKSADSAGSRPRHLSIVYKCCTSTEPDFSASNISKMHLKLSISSREYILKIYSFWFATSSAEM